MSTIQIPWAPRAILVNRTFRLPVQAPDEHVTLEAEGFRLITSRWCAIDSAVYHYLTASNIPGDYTLRASHNRQTAEVTIQVRTLEEFRTIHQYNGATWPRRWPVGQTYQTTKTRQTLQDLNIPETLNEQAATWWIEQTDETVWQQLPPSELPKAHYTNVHHGCPNCGTAIYRYGGFYPWSRNHLPCDFKSTCPNCNAVFPSNSLTSQDYTSGQFPDDGYGYFDKDEHIFIFAASYHRDQCRTFGSGIDTLTAYLRKNGPNEQVARRLGLMLLRYAQEECYVASAPQFRFGAQIGGTEEPWNWGQPDWASQPDPVHALKRKGTQRYAIDTPNISRTLALAYDTIWPHLLKDTQLVSSAQSLGLHIQSPKDAAQLIEEMLAILLQNILDGGAGSNLPNESQGTLVLLRCLDRPDAQSVMDWLYDEGPDTLRVFTTNDFSPDGTPPESTGGYNSIHTYGFFGLEQHLRGLRQQQPSAYPESRYPSLVTDPRTPHIVRHPYEITMIGKTYFQFGDGSAPGTSSQLGGRDDQKENSIRLQQDYFQAPLGDRVLDLAAELTGDPVVQEIRDTVEHRQHRNHGPTIHDNMGVAILRTSETPERAAAGIAYGDTHGHRHRDLLDVQLFAFERPFLTDLGYPQSWASRPAWEDHWATHNTVWGALPDGPIENIAGRGKLLRTLFIDGLQILDIEAYRWIWDETQKCWVRPGVTYHRLLALVETDGEGVALVDLSRITGGIEHWRTCRGLEGEFHSDNTGLQPRNGTVANPGAKRGDTSQLTHPDHKALAYMDDVASGQAPASWNGAWQSRFESAVHLDLHQLHVSPSTELLTARATAMMGNPDASTYNFRSVLWHRKPQNDTTCIDLVFEPRIDAPTLATAETISSDSKTATGVRLTTRQGKQIELYWAPGTKPENITQFENGARLQGPLAAIVNGKIATTGTTEFQTSKKSYTFPNAIQTATITALDRTARTIDAQGLTSISSGDRIVINPNGRAHSYLVETVETLDNNRHRLTLNVVSILARGKILVRDKNRIEIGMQGNPSNLIRLHAQARTGNLHSTRFEPETGEPWAEIQTASNPGNDRTVIHLHPDHVERLGNLDIGTWMRIVDYEIGDTVRFEPTYTA